MAEIPRTLGAYPIERELGRGGMGVVYLGRDPRLDREVAIKVLPDAFATDPERLARFEREARLLASLKHSNIAVIHGLEEANGQRLIVLEYVEGDTLAERIARHALPVEESLDVCRQIAAAVEAAHEGGVIHRDLKPGNVKIAPSGEVKVLDFGLAKGAGVGAISGASDDASHSPTLTYMPTGMGVILGTAAYMSPEQARGKAVDKRTDIWSFACILYECLTGHQTFAGETVSDTIARILEREPDWSALPPRTPESVRVLLARCLEKDPRKRLRDIGDARIELERALSARTPSGRIAAAPPVGSSARGSRGLAAALALGVALGAVGGILSWNTIGPGARVRSKARTLDQVSHLAVRLPSNMRFDSAILTPDGSAFVCRGSPRVSEGRETTPQKLYLRRLDRDGLTEYPGTLGVIGGGPSEDGRSVVMVAPVSLGATRKRIYRMALDGGSPPLPLAEWKDEYSGFVTLSNGDIVIFTDQGASFQRIHAAGGEPSAPKKTDRGDFRGTLTFRRALPGDKAALVNGIGYGERGWYYRVGVLDLESGRVRFVIDDGGNAIYAPTGHLVFTRGEVLMAAPFDLRSLKVNGAPVTLLSGLRTRFNVEPANFWLGSNGTLVYPPGGTLLNERRLAFVDAAGNVRPWSEERRPFGIVPSITEDGRRFAVVITNPRGIDEIWMSDLDRPSLRRIIAVPDADCDLGAVSPDGEWIAYTRNGRDSLDGVYVQRADSQSKPSLVCRPPNADAGVFPIAWTPDGRSLLLQVFAGGRNHALLLPDVLQASGPIEPRPIVRGFFDETVPVPSPDGRLLAFCSSETGRSETYVCTFHQDGSVSDPIRVSSDGGQLGLWGAGGRRLDYLDLNNRLMSVSISTQPRLAAGPPTLRFDAGRQQIASLAPLPDGRYFAIVTSELETNDISSLDVVLDFFEEIQRRTRGAR